MFKLIKIINSGVNVPELRTMNKDTNVSARSGELLKMNSAGRLTNCSYGDKPKYIAVSSAERNEPYVVCFEIMPNMLFESRLNGEPRDVSVGMKVSLEGDEDGYLSSVSSSNEYEIATIYDMTETKRYGDKIVVRFE